MTFSHFIEYFALEFPGYFYHCLVPDYLAFVLTDKQPELGLRPLLSYQPNPFTQRHLFYIFILNHDCSLSENKFSILRLTHYCPSFNASNVQCQGQTLFPSLAKMFIAFIIITMLTVGSVSHQQL